MSGANMAEPRVRLFKQRCQPGDIGQLAARIGPRRREQQVIRFVPAQNIVNQIIPSRRVVLAWRRSFTRYEAIAALRNAVVACELPGVKRVN